VNPNNSYQSGEGLDPDSVPPRESSDGAADPLVGNPYSTQYQRATVPDLDGTAPQLRSHDLKRMNQRALFLLAAVVLLLLFVAYWMITRADNHTEQSKLREEKVTVAEAPRSLALPQHPVRQPDPIPLAQQPAPSLPPLSSQPMAVPQATHGPTLLQRRIVSGDDAAANQQPANTGLASQASGLPGVGSNASALTSARPLTHPDTLMQRGTYIRCVLETRIISDIPGFSSCLVTEPVYSFNGHRLLLPKGSKVLGSYQNTPNTRRVEVVWDRIITPTGIDVNMSSPGMDNLGGAGLPGHYDAHWPSRISSALLISMLSDAFKYEAAEHGPRSTTITNGVVTQEPFESNTAQTVQNLANQAVQASANRPATVTINQGTVIYVYVAKDVDFNGVVTRF
jgi:type IV secretion system protein VirB10